MIYNEKEIYTLNGVRQNLPGFNEKYHNIVDYILKITYEIWEQRAVWVIYDTYDENIPVHTGAGTLYGVDTVVNGTIKMLSAFPDRKMNGEAVIWSKVNDNHFYSSHRIGSTATNLGDTDFGKATGKKVFFRTIADCLVSENNIIEEWLVRDNLFLIEQLGFDPVEMAKLDSRYKEGVPSNHHTNSVLSDSLYDGVPLNADVKKPEQLLYSLFESIWKTQDFSKLEECYDGLAKVHSICGKELEGPHELRAYLEYLFASFSKVKVEIQRITCNELEDNAEVAVRWKLIATHSGDGFFGPASGKEIIMPGICHYIVKDGKIQEEWMVFDGFDVLCQIYADVKIETTASQNEAADNNFKNKKGTLAFIQEMNNASNVKEDVTRGLQKYFSKDITLNITKPFEKIIGLEGFAEKFWLPLSASFPDLENQPYILIGGKYEGREYVSFTGNFIGTWEKDWLGIPATHQPAWIRYSTTFLFEKNKIVKAWYFFDTLDILRQAGFNFFPSKGIQHIPPAPMTGDGILNSPTGKTEGQRTLDLTNAMLNALGKYDGKTLESMGQERFWDVQNMMWYGPSGIGTTRGLKGFQNNHQVPFLISFPDRGIIPKKGKDYFAQIGDGHYSCDFGFPAMYGTHNGDAWLGLKNTGKKITLRVVDYWRREGDRLVENWVLIDMIDVLEQLDIDVFELLQKEINKTNG